MNFKEACATVADLYEFEPSLYLSGFYELNGSMCSVRAVATLTDTSDQAATIKLLPAARKFATKKEADDHGVALPEYVNNMGREYAIKMLREAAR